MTVFPVRKGQGKFRLALARFARDSHGAPKTRASLSVAHLETRDDRLRACLLSGEFYVGDREALITDQLAERLTNGRECLVFGHDHWRADEDAQRIVLAARELARLKGLVPIQDRQRERPAEVDDG